MKLIVAALWMLLWATVGIFSVWLLANSPEVITGGVTVREAGGLFCIGFSILYSMQKISQIEHEYQESKKDKGQHGRSGDSGYPKLGI